MTPAPHLSEEDLIELLDQRASQALRDHAASCPACGARAESLRHAWALAEADHVPEPSPLFWDHLSARVGQAIRTEAETGRRWTAWRWAFAAAPVLLVVLAIAGVWRVAPGGGPPTPPVASTGGAAGEVVEAAVPTAIWTDDRGTAAEAIADVIEDDGIWELVALLSESLADDDGESAVFEPRLGAAERALSQLSAAEQQVLARLIEEIVGTGPS